MMWKWFRIEGEDVNSANLGRDGISKFSALNNAWYMTSTQYTFVKYMSESTKLRETHLGLHPRSVIY